jgi:hypothetical protein
LEHFTDSLDILWPFGTFCVLLVHFFWFWFHVPRKIWQPWYLLISFRYKKVPVVIMSLQDSSCSFERFFCTVIARDFLGVEWGKFICPELKCSARLQLRSDVK